MILFCEVRDTVRNIVEAAYLIYGHANFRWIQKLLREMSVLNSLGEVESMQPPIIPTSNKYISRAVPPMCAAYQL
mgnify:CR=1 FL=1